MYFDITVALYTALNQN